MESGERLFYREMKKKASNKSVAIVVILIVFFVVSFLLYRKANADTSFEYEKIQSYSELKLKKAQNILDKDHAYLYEDGLFYRFGKPHCEEKYDKNFKENVYVYYIPYLVANISGENIQSKINECFKVVSAGDCWDALSIEDLQNSSILNGSKNYVKELDVMVKKHSVKTGVVVVESGAMKTEKLSGQSLKKFRCFLISKKDNRTMEYEIK